MKTPRDSRQDSLVPIVDLAEATAGAMASSTVLVVDDSSVNVTLLERLLHTAGVARVHGFTDPRDALAHCATSLPDLVLLDLCMPGLDGFAFMAALQDLVSEPGFVPVLVLTADDANEVRRRALAAGAKDFLAKPFDSTEVLQRVTNLLETRALYRRLEQHNTELRTALHVRMAAEEEAAAENERRERRVDLAVAPDSLTMVFQPVAVLATGEVVGAEALARFVCKPPRPPNEWFAEAEDIGRGAELELAAITAALQTLDRLPGDAFLAVNVSPSTAVTVQLARLLGRYPGERVVLELTEHTRVADYEALLIAMERLRRRGVRIAVDDTGAGYASFQHLLRLRPDILKLDTTLTADIHDDPIRRALASALVTFSNEIGAIIIAEGIEVADELATLQSIGIPWGQGYHLARPGGLPLPDRARWT